MSSEIQQILAELHRQFERLYGERLVKIILFGSQVRGDAEPGSDIDLLIVLQGQVRPSEEIEKTINITADISLKNDTVISCVFTSLNRFLAEQSPLLINIRREGVAL